MADYYSRQRKRNLTVGIFVVLGLCALFYMVFKFQDLPLWVTKSKSYTIKVQFPSAPGVSKSTPVRFCGYEVGRVTMVGYPQLRADRYDPNLVYHQTLVTLAINKKYRDIPSNVNIRIMKRGLGSSYVEIVVDKSKKTIPLITGKPESAFLGPGLPVLQGTTGQASEFFPEETQKKAEELVDRFNTLLANANAIIGNRGNQNSIKELLVNAKQATAEATETLKEIKKLSSTGVITLDSLRDKFKTVTNTIESSGVEFTYALRQLKITLERANSGNGTAARLLNDGKLYENLLDSSRELQLALEQLRNLVAESRDKGLPIRLK